MREIYIISLALNQTKFWSKIINKLKKKNIKIITFDTESSNYLISNNIHISANNKISNKKKDYSLTELIKKFKYYKVKDFNKLMYHEYIFFGKRNRIQILNDFLRTLEFFYETFKNKKNICFIQEIGGFIPNISAFIFAKNNKLDHYFLETSFFQNYYHILKNTINCDPMRNTKQKINFERYLKNIKKFKKINIPKKDELHFKTPAKKIFNLYNFKRFFIKKFKQIILGYQFVFGFDFLILKNSILNYFNYLRLSKYYSNLDFIEKKSFVYFPLHVPNDFALTIRSPKYQNQLELIDKIAKKIYPKKILIKEHPARIGAFNFQSFLKLISKNKNIIIADPKINNILLLEKCDFIFTINSKAGFEAMVFKKKIFSFGESFYKNSKLVKQISKIENFKNVNYLNSIKYERLRADFFKEFTSNLFRGSLYVNETTNVNNFAKSIKKIL